LIGFQIDSFSIEAIDQIFTECNNPLMFQASFVFPDFSGNFSKLLIPKQ